MERRGRHPLYGLYRTDILEVMKGKNFVILYDSLVNNTSLVPVRLDGKDYVLDSRILSGITDERSLKEKIENIGIKKYHIAYSVKNYPAVIESKTNPIIGQMSNPIILTKLILSYFQTKGINISITPKKRGRRPRNLLETRVDTATISKEEKPRNLEETIAQQKSFLNLAREAIIEMGYPDPLHPRRKIKGTTRKRRSRPFTRVRDYREADEEPTRVRELNFDRNN